MARPTTLAVSGSLSHKVSSRSTNESMWAGRPNYEGVCDVDDHATALMSLDTGATLDLQIA